MPGGQGSWGGCQGGLSGAVLWQSHGVYPLQLQPPPEEVVGVGARGVHGAAAFLVPVPFVVHGSVIMIHPPSSPRPKHCKRSEDVK